MPSSTPVWPCAILVHGYPVKCFACILFRGANFADKSTLLYQPRAIRSTSHSFVPCVPDILYLPPDILGNIFIFLLLQESRVGHYPAPFFPPASTIFLWAVPELISYHLLSVADIQDDNCISEKEHQHGFSRSGLILPEAFQEVLSRANKLVFLIFPDVLQLQSQLPAIFPSLRILEFCGLS